MGNAIATILQNIENQPFDEEVSAAKYQVNFDSGKTVSDRLEMQKIFNLHWKIICSKGK